MVDLVERGWKDTIVNHLGDDRGDGSDREREGRREKRERQSSVEGSEGDEVRSESLFLDLPATRTTRRAVHKTHQQGDAVRERVEENVEARGS